MALTSQLAAFSYGGTTVAEVGTASISLQRPPLETTALGTGAQSFIGGIGGATATLDVFYDKSSAGHSAMSGAVNSNSASAACVITLQSGDTYSGNAFVTGFDITAQSGSLTRATITLQFTTASPGANIVTKS